MIQIIAYSTVSADIPESFRACARILHLGKKPEWHPVIFTAETAPQAAAMAQAWWDEELAKAEAKRNRPAPRRRQHDDESGEVQP